MPRTGTTDLLGPAGGRCAACILTPPATDEVRAVVAYDSPARAFLLRAKLGGRRELLEPLGQQLATMLEGARVADSCTAVVPVPSHPWLNLRRGFRPALELARPTARRLALPLLPWVLCRRFGTQLATKRMGRAARRRMLVAGSFRVRRRLEGERLLLVDDVMTTGATVDGCARALKQAGAREVRVAVWARTLPHV